MRRITDLTILQEFTNDSKTFGIYWCKFNGNYHLFTRNGDVVKVLTHSFDHDDLSEIWNIVKDELFEEIENLKNK
jgi:hypothetical protein